MRTISADIEGNVITCLVFEHYPDGSVRVVDESFILRSRAAKKFTKDDELLVRNEYPNLPRKTKLFVCVA